MGSSLMMGMVMGNSFMQGMVIMLNVYEGIVVVSSSMYVKGGGDQLLSLLCRGVGGIFCNLVWRLVVDNDKFPFG